MLGFWFLLPILGIDAEPVDPLPPGKIELSTKESAALHRLIQRLKQQQGSTDSAALLKLLTCPEAQQLEDMYTSCLQQRGEKELKGTTVQDQVSEEVDTPWGSIFNYVGHWHPFLAYTGRSLYLQPDERELLGFYW